MSVLVHATSKGYLLWLNGKGVAYFPSFGDAMGHAHAAMRYGFRFSPLARPVEEHG